MSSAAATSSTDCTGAGSSRLRSRKACSTRADRCSWVGSGEDPPSWSAVSSAGSSSSASGLPPVSSMRRSVTPGAGARPSRWSRRARAAFGSSPESTSSSMPAGRKVVGASSRAEKTRSTRSAPSRRAQNSSESALAASSQWASSTTHSTVVSSAAAVSSDRVATATRKGSTDGPSSSPNATRRARAWGTGRPSRSRITGSSSRCSAANASGASVSRPWVRNTHTSPASLTAWRRDPRAGRTCRPRFTADHHAARRSVPCPIQQFGQVRALPLAAD